MYQRLSVQQRVCDFLDWEKDRKWRDIRVRPGHMINPYLENYEKYISDPSILQQAIAESEIKQEGVATSINFNISNEAGKKLSELKGVLDQTTQRHLYPAQVLDILLICVRLGSESQNDKKRDISDKEIAMILLDFVRDLIGSEIMPINKINAKQDIIEVLEKNNLL